MNRPEELAERRARVEVVADPDADRVAVERPTTRLVAGQPAVPIGLPLRSYLSIDVPTGWPASSAL